MIRFEITRNKKVNNFEREKESRLKKIVVLRLKLILRKSEPTKTYFEIILCMFYINIR
jgi:hypothetical protein